MEKIWGFQAMCNPRVDYFFSKFSSSILKALKSTFFTINFVKVLIICIPKLANQFCQSPHDPYQKLWSPHFLLLILSKSSSFVFLNYRINFVKFLMNVKSAVVLVHIKKRGLFFWKSTIYKNFSVNIFCC